MTYPSNPTGTPEKILALMNSFLSLAVLCFSSSLVIRQAIHQQ